MSNNLLDKASNGLKTSKNFEQLLCVPGFKPARDIIQTIPQSFIDKDGNFRVQFQTTEFNQRFWELLLYKVFVETGYEVIGNKHESPDFEIQKDGKKVFIEAVTTNETQNDRISSLLIKGIKSNLFEKIRAFFSEQLLKQYSIKISNALYSKLQKKYWGKEWVRDYPLLIAIEAFHNPYTNLIPDSKIIEYLYKKKLKIDVDERGNQKSEYSEIGDLEYGYQKKPSGFFELPDSENISAVIFYNERPIWKFNRMGYISGSYENIIMKRYGLKYNPGEGALEPEEYILDITNEEYSETWEEGISIFHNPKAKVPLEKDFFSNYRQIWINKGKYDGFIPEFFPFTSNTIMICNGPQAVKKRIN